MPINSATAPAGGGKKSPALDPATYPGRLVQIIDLGLQRRSFQGEDKEPMRKIALVWELVDEFLEDENGQPRKDKPRWITEDFPLFNLSADKATSTKRYLALDPAKKFGGEWSELLNVPALITTINNKNNKNGQVYTNVAAVAAMREKDAVKCPPLINSPKYFDLDDPDIATFMGFAQYMQDKVKANLNYKGSKLEELLKDAGSGEPSKNAGPSTPPKQNPASEQESEETPY